MTNRSTAQRANDARARLESEPNIWLATASDDGSPHLVPLSLAWIEEQIVVATPADTPTARNAISNGRVRAALDSADDVVIFDADAAVINFDDAESSLVATYIDRVGWDPRDNPGVWSLLILTPRRAHAWNGPSEISGRTIVREGQWLDRPPIADP